MKDCLLTALKADSENLNLPYFDGLDINIELNGGTSAYLLIYSTKLISSDLFVNTTTGTATTEEIAGYNGKIQLAPVADGEIILKDVVHYGITSLEDFRGVFPDFIVRYDTSFYQKLEDLTRMTSINVSGKNVTGKMTDFIAITSLNYLILGITRSSILRASKVTGSIEEFAAGQVANGRTSGSCNVYCNGVITCNGSTPTAESVKVVTFNQGLPNGYSIADA